MANEEVAKGQEVGAAYLIIRSKVKEAINQKGFNSGEEAIEELNKQVMRLIDRAAERAEANKRKTLKACDF
jgi:histone H3/H4